MSLQRDQVTYFSSIAFIWLSLMLGLCAAEMDVMTPLQLCLVVGMFGDDMVFIVNVFVRASVFLEFDVMKSFRSRG